MTKSQRDTAGDLESTNAYCTISGFRCYQ